MTFGDFERKENERSFVLGPIVPKITALRQTERRDRILDAAERCFARSGFQGATMAEICADAGVSAGGAYLYFRSKEDLIAGIAERDRERIAGDFARLADAPDFFAALMPAFVPEAASSKSVGAAAPFLGSSTVFPLDPKRARVLGTARADCNVHVRPRGSRRARRAMSAR